VAAESTTPSAADAAALLSLSIHADADPGRPLRDVVGDTPAVVTIAASYCAPCRFEVPVLHEAVRRWKPEEVRVVAIAADVHDPKRLVALRADWNIDYPTYWVAADAEPQLQKLLPAGMPSTFFVKGGSVVRHDRLLTDASLVELVREHLGVAAAVP
jgi:thiol-disulfide isomerase/thioredoxin